MRRRVLALLLVASALAAGCVSHAPRASSTADYDVIVVGAAPGGVAAAIQAARMGERVALFEETDWVGGQMTAAGVGTLDEGSPAARQSGLYHEFVQRALAFYRERGKAVDTCYWDPRSFCVDPQVGQQVIRDMLGAQADRLLVVTGTRIVGVTRAGDRVTGIVTAARSYSASVVVDADPYGDVLAMSGAEYRLGNGTAEGTDATAGTCIQDITYGAIIRHYPDGVPADLVMGAPPPGYDAEVAAHFAQYLAANGTEARWENGVLRVPHPLSFASYEAYRGLPDLASATNGTRTLLNLGNDYPMIGSLSTRYISDPAYRERANTGAKLLTLQLLYYIQHDLGHADWSLADDEGYDTAYNRAHHDPALAGFERFEDLLPQEPYVREGRRAVGVETLTGDALASGAVATGVPDSIAVGYYPMDLHGCKASLEAAFDARNATAHGRFEVPLGVVIPAAVDGLLVTDNNIAASREANGATREQPIAMDIGQAAGALAALAAQRGEAPRDVPAPDVQSALVAAGAVVR